MNGPRELTYFTDRDLGHQFPRVLQAAGLRVERHDDHFGALTRDEEWLSAVGERGWIAVTYAHAAWRQIPRAQRLGPYEQRPMQSAQKLLSCALGQSPRA